MCDGPVVKNRIACSDIACESAGVAGLCDPGKDRAVNPGFTRHRSAGGTRVEFWDDLHAGLEEVSITPKAQKARRRFFRGAGRALGGVEPARTG